MEVNTPLSYVHLRSKLKNFKILDFHGSKHTLIVSSSSIKIQNFQNTVMGVEVNYRKKKVKNN